MNHSRHHPGRVLLLGSRGWLGSTIAESVAVVPVPTSPVLAASTDVVLPGLGPQDIVVNAAGSRGGSEEEMTAINEVLPLRLAKACQQTGSHLIHLGSAAELGGDSSDPHSPPLTESAQPAPQSTYARTKLAGTESVLSMGGTVLRVFNVADGPPQAGTPLHDILDRIIRTPPGSPVSILNADTQRDFVSREFVTRSVIAAMALVPVGLFHICSGIGTAMGTLVQELVARLNPAAFGVRSERPRVDRIVGDPHKWIAASGLCERLDAAHLANLVSRSAQTDLLGG